MAISSASTAPIIARSSLAARLRVVLGTLAMLAALLGIGAVLFAAISFRPVASSQDASGQAIDLAQYAPHMRDSWYADFGQPASPARREQWYLEPGLRGAAVDLTQYAPHMRDAWYQYWR